MKKTILLLLLTLFVAPLATAFIQVEGIQTDPSIIAAGDEVDIIIDYRVFSNQDRLANPEYKLRVLLTADDDVSREYLDVRDREGNTIFTTPRAETLRTTQFRVKVDEQAPTGQYELTLQAQWYRNDRPTGELITQRIRLDVKKHAILLDVADIQASPQRLLPGTREAQIMLSIANNGEKTARNVQLETTLPEGMRPSHANGARANLGSILAEHTNTATLTIDLNRDLLAGEYELTYLVTYLDESNNEYEQLITRTLFVSPKPQLIIEQTNTTIRQGNTELVTFTITNTGLVAAEAIDARLLKESSQPFELDTRSGYISKLGPNQSATISIPVSATRHASPAEYTIPVMIRAKGDSNEHDHNTYTFRETTTILVEERTTNNLVFAAIIIVVLAGLTLLLWRKKK